MIMRYCDDNFQMRTMNTIGIDFKIKKVTVDDQIVKLQIVGALFCCYCAHYFKLVFSVGYCRTRKV